MITINQLKKLRSETGVSIIECQKALKEAKGDVARAKEILKIWGKKFAGKKSERKVKQGILDVYLHPNRKIGVLLEVLCESDFVAKSEEFKKLAHELCLQIAAMNPGKNFLFKQPWIRDETKTIQDLINEYIAKLGENIVVKRFMRYEI